MARRNPKHKYSLAEYRKLYTAAKKAGLVKRPVKTSQFKPSKYYRTKLNHIASTLEPQEKTTTLPPLRPGEMEIIDLPQDAMVSFDTFARWVKTHPAVIEATKHPDERWAFMIYGHPSLATFDDIDSLIKYVLSQYSRVDEDDDFPEDFFLFRSLQDWRFDREALKRERRIRKRPTTQHQREIRATVMDEYWHRHPKKYEEHKRHMREYQAAKRKTETAAQKKIRLKKSREYMRQRRGK